MEKEIKVRKRRFAAFWTAVLLVCCLIVPLSAGASTASGLTDGGMNGALILGGELTHTGNFSVLYRDFDGTELYGYYYSAGEIHTVMGYPNGGQFLGWKLAVSEAEGETLAILTARLESGAVFSSGGVSDGQEIPEGEHYLYSYTKYILKDVTRVQGDPSTYVNGTSFYIDGGIYGSGNTFTFLP